MNFSLPVLESKANIFAQGNSNGIVSVATVKIEYLIDEKPLRIEEKKNEEFHLWVSCGRRWLNQEFKLHEKVHRWLLLSSLCSNTH